MKNQRYLLYVFFLSVFMVTLFIGRMEFFPFSMNGIDKVILFDVRLPRAIIVSLAGASLGLAGVAFQNLFRNYLAGPGILGVTSGSAFGAVFAILLFQFNAYLIQGFSFIFGIIAVALAYKLGSMIGKGVLSLILAGMVISAIFGGFIGLAKYLADPYNKLPTIVFWLLGSFAGIRWTDVKVSFLPMVIGIIGLISMRWIFNILSLGDEEATALGVNVKKWKTTAIIFATLAASAATSVGGMIAWIGVVSPHIARLVSGVDNKKLVPMTAIIGALLLLLCDTVARSLTPSEIPLSVVTDFVGAPILFIILVKRRSIYYVKD